MKHLKKALCALLSVAFAFGIFAIVPQSKAEAAFVVDYEPNCDAVYMVNLDTGIVVYEKNADKIKYPASTTKMMTCMLALEYFSDPASEYYTISRTIMTDKTCINAGVWSTGYLVEGERVRLKDLLHCAMLPSDNYAALAIAYFVSEQKGDGSLEWFINRMNTRAKELGCTNTQFINPNGLFHEEHYSTAHDLFLIAREAMSIPYFAEIVNTTVYFRPATNMNPQFGEKGARLENTNKMLSTAYQNGSDPNQDYYYQYVKGIKTGFLIKAGHCLASYATKDGYSYMCICLDDGAQSNNKDPNLAMIDAKTLYQWAFSSLSLKEIVSTERPLPDPVNLGLAWGRDTVDIYPAESFTTLMPSHVEPSSIMIKTDLPETVDAPLKKGQVLGKAQLIYGSEVIGTVDVVAGETIQRSELLYFLNLVSNLFQSTAFVIILVLLLLSAIGYVVFSLMRTRNIGSLKRNVHRYRHM